MKPRSLTQWVAARGLGLGLFMQACALCVSLLPVHDGEMQAIVFALAGLSLIASRAFSETP